MAGIVSSRRNFIRGLLSTGTLFCVGRPHLLKAHQTDEKHKFEIDSKMSFQEVYGFAYSRGFIPLMKVLGQEIGEEKFIDMLKKASDKTTEKAVQQWADSVDKNDLDAFMADMKNPNHFWKHVLTFEIVEESKTAVEVKISECLWAKTFRASDASDIGYACICYPDFTMAKSFNPKMKLIRTKTLMQGDECCNHRYVMET